MEMTVQFLIPRTKCFCFCNNPISDNHKSLTHQFFTASIIANKITAEATITSFFVCIDLTCSNDLVLDIICPEIS